MAECFCGCGRQVGWTLRGANKQGQRTVRLIERLKITRGQVASKAAENDADVAALRAAFETMIHDGEVLGVDWLDIVHKEKSPSPAEALTLKREWNAWGRTSRAINSMAKRRSPREVLDVIESAAANG